MEISDQLKHFIKYSGLSLNELSRRSGVSKSILSTFMRSDRTITLTTACRICKVLELKLIPYA